MRITEGTNAWRTVERVTGDRPMSRKRKRNVLSSCVTPAYRNALMTIALAEKQLKVQDCEKKLVIIIVGAKRADKRKWMR